MRLQAESTPAALRQTAEREFRARFHADPSAAAMAPGRVNLIGEHVDYLGGLVLPAAVDRFLAVATGPAREWQLVSDTPGGSDHLRALGEELGAEPQRVSVVSDIPAGAGLSSSAALLVALARALRPDLDGHDAALAAQAAEQRATGAQIGVMDPMACALGQSGYALLLNCDSLEYRPVRFPDDIVIAVVDSGTARRLVDTPYNQRRQEAEAAVAASSIPLLELDDGGENPRLRHVVSELKRVRAFTTALEGDDRAQLGAILNASHASLRDDFEVSTPEVDAIVARAQGAPGCLGARIMGAGFGGSILALLEKGAEPAFAEAVAAPVTICATASGAFVEQV